MAWSYALVSRGATRLPQGLLVAAWFLALGLNVMLWGQEVMLAQAPGLICLVQLMLLVPLLWLASKALHRHGQSALYRGLLLATAAGMLAYADLLVYLQSGTEPAEDSIHWVRHAGETIGPLPSALLAVLLVVCLLNCQLQAYWEAQASQ